MGTVSKLLKKTEQIPRVHLTRLPTPLQRMHRLTKLLNGPRLWIKRDDYTCLAFGENKERKAEFVMADVIAKKADVGVTIGSVQSNHARITAAAARNATSNKLLDMTEIRVMGQTLARMIMKKVETLAFECGWDDEAPVDPISAWGSVCMDDFEILKPISKGAFGRVYLARKNESGELFAIKVMRKADLVRKNMVESARNERNILAMTNNPFVIRFFFYIYIT